MRIIRPARICQFPTFHPKGWSEMSLALKSFVTKLSTPTSAMRIICKGAECIFTCFQTPIFSKKSCAGCRYAVVRKSAPLAEFSVMGGFGSTQRTSKPASPKAVAATRPAIPPPEITTSFISVIDLVLIRLTYPKSSLRQDAPGKIRDLYNESQYNLVLQYLVR